MNLSKITVSNNFVQIHTGEGGGVIELGNPEGRGAQAVLEIQVDGGGGVPSITWVWIFSGITQFLLKQLSEYIIE